MRLTSSRAYTRPPPVPKMPPGLVELMDGLARDVLMHNPGNVYEFCASHMEKLLEIRDGPSSKKPLTLEQKILKIQEKMRQKAQERREKFDKEIKLQSDDNDVKVTTLVSEDLEVPGPSLKAPIHHDLKNASEVEISHIPHLEKPLQQTDNLKIDESNTTTEETLSLLNDNLVETENQNIEIINDSHHEPEIETKYNNNLNDELFFGKVDKEEIGIEPLKESKLEEINMAAMDSPLQTITEASEENFVSDSATLILPKITIGDEGRDPDYLFDESGQEMHLDIIKEFIDEGTAKCSPEKSSEIQNKSENSKSSDVPDNANNESVVPLRTHEPEKTPHVVQNDKEDIGDSTCTSPNNEKQKDDNISQIIQVSNSPTVTEIVKANTDNDNLQQAESSGYNSNASTDETHETDNTNLVISLADKPEVIDSQNEDSVNDPAHKDFIEDKETTATDLIEDSNVSVIEGDHDTKENELNLKVETVGNYEQLTTDNEVDTKAETGHLEITADNEANLKAEPDVGSVQSTTENEVNLKIETDVGSVQMTTENEFNLKTEADVEHVNMTTGNESNLKAETNVENVNMTDIHNTELNKSIDNAKIEPEIIQRTLKADEVNLDNDYEKHNDNTEVSLQKSDSTENTNEDSISMVESDLSKTDDDSAQNNPNMDLENAAVTIQKVFRSFMFKSRNSTFDDTINDEHNSIDEDNDQKEEYYAAANLNKERRPLGITRMDTVLQTVNEEKSLSLSTDDSSTLSSAATTIQAHVRGFLVRNRLNSSKTFSMNSLVNSHEVLEADTEQHKNKTILNIHIVPEEGNYLSRDESLITSMDLSLDGSPPSSVNLHPLSCDISERRKMLKREDAVQSVTPPSNNSGKLSEDSVKEVLINENGVLERELSDDKTIETDDPTKELDNETSDAISSASTVTPTTVITISKSEDLLRSPRENTEPTLRRNGTSLTKLSSDESDVITPFVPSPRSSEVGTKLIHSGEFHDVVLPTKVSRNDASAVRGE